MESPDKYRTILGSAEGLYRERGSKFIGLAVGIESVEDAMSVIESMRKEHPKARHHCYAYRLGVEGTNFRANDDGEPSGTGGKPILGQIDSFDLTDLVVVVTRYFGGKLLGAAGLAVAYKLSAQDALNRAEIEIREIRVTYQVDFKYEVMGTLMDALGKYGAQISHQSFEASAFLRFTLPKSHDPYILDLIIAAALGKYPEEILGERNFDLIQIQTLD